MFESLHQVVVTATGLVCHGLANQPQFSNTGESNSSQLAPPEPHSDLASFIHLFDQVDYDIPVVFLGELLAILFPRITLLSAAMIFSAISCSDISQVSPFLPSSIKSQVAF